MERASMKDEPPERQPAVCGAVCLPPWTVAVLGLSIPGVIAGLGAMTMFWSIDAPDFLGPFALVGGIAVYVGAVFGFWGSLAAVLVAGRWSWRDRASAPLAWVWLAVFLSVCGTLVVWRQFPNLGLP
jgi:hypothetical protein